MKKIRMCVDTDKTFAEGFEEYILDCKSRNLRDGTLRHYRESIKQIYKRVPPDTLISDLDEYTIWRTTSDTSLSTRRFISTAKKRLDGTLQMQKNTRCVCTIQRLGPGNKMGEA